MFVSTAPVEIAFDTEEERIVRVGATVRRPMTAASPAVHALLAHLEAVGFDGAPRVIGVDGQDREILTFVDGETATRPLPAWAVSDETLAALARLLRRFHDAAESFVPPPDAVWEQGSQTDESPELVGHCDVTPENVVFRPGPSGRPMPYALIDFDLARPTTRLFDVVTTLRHWAPIADPIDRDPRQRGMEVGPRLRLFCDAYGLSVRDRLRLIDTARTRLGRSYVATRTRALTLGGDWARRWAEGAGERIRRAGAWLDAHEDELRRHLIEGA
ncbi:phosphotransferase [Microtetraspora fusca]|uniref:Phosphotransferase n=1 Tax=Microtetraspora fusca TaxID=1997 RepID=A0ABW6V530_MICFU